MEQKETPSLGVVRDQFNMRMDSAQLDLWKEAAVLWGSRRVPVTTSLSLWIRTVMDGQPATQEVRDGRS